MWSVNFVLLIPHAVFEKTKLMFCINSVNVLSLFLQFFFQFILIFFAMFLLLFMGGIRAHILYQ